MRIGYWRTAMLCGLTAFSLSAAAHAGPQGGQVVSGSGTISQSGGTTTINQSSQNMSVNWKSFNIGASETVNFRQPNASALAVNRISDPHGSTIMGHLNANGQIYLINPNGILFGAGAQVNVGGLVASTLDTADGSTFSGNGTGSIVNEGTINAARYVALLGKSVINSGVITARLGTVTMGAGSDVSLTFSGNSLVKLQVNRSVIDSLVANHGLIEADGGMVVMNAGARDTLLASVVNNDGIVQARTVASHNGTITLLGGMQGGTVNVGGTIDASAPNGGDGGFIETSAAHVHIANSANITTLAANGANGIWLIDPVDFTIASSGGDMTGAAVGTALAGGNFTIQSTSGSSGSSGNINVNDAVTWSANTLTLNAQKDINIKSSMTGTGTAALALEYGQSAVNAGNSSDYYLTNGASVTLPSGSTFSTKLGSDGGTNSYTVITSLGSAGSVTTTDLQGMSGNLAGNYALGADIDATATSGWNAGSGFSPVGDGVNFFTGSFAGLGHTISNLTINRLTANHVGLFGYAAGGILRDVGLVSSSISGNTAVGALAGWSSSNTIEYVYASGGSVTADQHLAGGLVGRLTGSSSISNSYATDSVTANNNGVSSTGIGGLVGQLVAGGSISNSYATGSVNGGTGTNVGGLVGQATGGSVTDSYATGAVSGTTYVGGLAGSNGAGATVATYTNDYWDTTTSGKATSYGGSGLTTAQMQASSNFSGWSIATSGGGSTTWRIYEGQSYPLLTSFLTPVTLTPSYTGSGSTTDIAAYTADIAGVNGSLILGNGNLTLQSTTTAGQATASLSGLYSTQQGYDISYAGKTVTGTGSAANDLNIANAITWTSGTLTLNAQNDINIKANLNGSGTAKLALQYGQANVNAGNTSDYYLSSGASVSLPAGSNFSTKLGSDGATTSYTVITSLGSAGSVTTTDLQGMSGDVTINYALGADIDATATSGWNGGNGFAPVGPSLAGKFTGTFDGLGHTIDSLTINRSGTSGVALFGYIGGAVRNVGVTNASIAGFLHSATLVGAIAASGTVSYSYASGSVTGGNKYSGGLVGYNLGTISNSHSSASVSSTSSVVGGLVGYSSGTVSNSYASGSVTGPAFVGGLVGSMIAGASISNSYASGSVTSSGSSAGGLVGLTSGGTITDSYATGAVSGTTHVGGLAGSNLLGATVATFTNSYWDTTTSGQSTSYGGSGLTTAQMQASSNFSGWSIATSGGGSTTWRIYEGQSYPLLKNFLTDLTVTANNASKTYDGLAYSGGNGVTYSVTPGGNLLGTLGYSGSSQGAVNAGSYVITPVGFYSNQQGYDITFADSALTVNTAPLTITFQPTVSDVNADTAALVLVRHPQQGQAEVLNASPHLPSAGSGSSGNGSSASGGGSFVGQGVPIPVMTVQLGDSATLNIVGGGVRLPSDSM